MRKALILGSSRNNGETKKLVSELMGLSNWELIDLSDYNISHFDYNHSNRDDDFIELMKMITEKFDVLISATPAYWYAMSGIMKVFFDRITDLLYIEIHVGRKLRNKSMVVITCSNGDNLGEQFWLPFQKTAEYLGINYIAGLHTLVDKIETQEIREFIEVVEEAADKSK